MDEVESAIVSLLASRRPEATICPSEVARRLWPDQWRPRMEEVRAAARRLVRSGRLEVTQKGEVVDAERARGPIRLRLLR